MSLKKPQPVKIPKTPPRPLQRAKTTKALLERLKEEKKKRKKKRNAK
jgi:Ni,Fe-hydrogenase III small subunit